MSAPIFSYPPGGGSGGREVVTSDRVYYVNGSTGSDSNDGLTALTPFETIQHAVNVVGFDIEIQNCNIDINVADVDYAENVLLPSYIGDCPQGSVRLVGSSDAKIIPATAPLFYAVFTSGRTWSIVGMTVTGEDCAPEWCDLFEGASGSTLILDGIEFGAAPGFAAWFDCSTGSTINVQGACTSDGVVGAFLYGQVNVNTIFTQNTGSITFTSDPAPEGGVGFDINSSTVYVHNSFTFSGTVTGQKYRNYLDGRLTGQGVPGLPGSTAGVTEDTSVTYGVTNFNGTVGNLPAVGSVPTGARATVTDSNATLAAGLGNVVVGGGANFCPVYSDGTNWRIG